MIRPLWLVALAVLASACSDNEECKQLRELAKKRKAVLGSAHSQAFVLERVERRATEMEARAKKAKADLGLDQPESSIQDILEARTKKIAGATLIRGTRMESVDESNPNAPQVSMTLWTVRFQEKDLQKVFGSVADVAKPPPLVKLVAIIREDRQKPAWRIELERAVVDEVPINPKPVVLPADTELANISSAFGFCGARRLRKEIEKVDAEIDSFRAEAEKTTVLLPASASWEGVRARTNLLRDVEFKYRDLLDLLEGAALAAKLPVKGLAVEGGLAILEVYGTPKDRPKLEQALVAKGMGASMRFPESAPPGVVRVGLPNTILEGRRQKREDQAQGADGK